MKKIIFTSLLLITPFCKSADFSSAMQYLARGMTDLTNKGFFDDEIDNISLYFKRANPSNFIFLDNKKRTSFGKVLNILGFLTGHQNDTILDLNEKIALCSLYTSQLSLTERKLTTIPANIYNLNFLYELNLSDNYISVISKKSPLPNLIYLYLENNHLQAIPNNIGHNFPNLYKLSLQDNSITTIPEGLNLPNLMYLYLNNNHIEYVNPKIINQFPKLFYLYLNQNPLTPNNIKQLKEAAKEADRHIIIIADDIGEKYASHSKFLIKSTKKPEEEPS